MTERMRRDNQGYMNIKKEACRLIKEYRENHPTIYLSSEKSFYYDFAIDEAYKEVRRSHDTPLNVLDRLLSRYDDWAHCGCENDEVFSIFVRAIDDLIDKIIS